MFDFRQAFAGLDTHRWRSPNWSANKILVKPIERTGRARSSLKGFFFRSNLLEAILLEGWFSISQTRLVAHWVGTKLVSSAHRSVVPNALISLSKGHRQPDWRAVLEFAADQAAHKSHQVKGENAESPLSPSCLPREHKLWPSKQSCRLTSWLTS